MINVNQLTLIQEIRALHALSECNIPIYIQDVDKAKLTYLKKYFNLKFTIGSCEGIELADVIKYDHSEPDTSIGSISRPLIYPKAIPTYLKSKWKTKKKYKYSFSGLLTTKRKKTIESWLQFQNSETAVLIDESMLSKLVQRIVIKLNIPLILTRKYGQLVFSSNHRGRTFPVKSWDKTYYQTLLNSDFVICPSGDYIWTYRFFESIMCGAIPIIEETCSAYEGFKYYTMTTPKEKLIISNEILTHNYNLCIKRLTLNKEDQVRIKEEIQKLITQR